MAAPLPTHRAPSTGDTVALPPRWLWPRTLWGQILFVAVIVLPLAFVVMDEGEFEPTMIVIPGAMLLLALFWRGVWVLIMRQTNRPTAAVGHHEGTASPASPPYGVPTENTLPGKTNWWTAALVIGGSGLLSFVLSGGIPMAGLVGLGFGGPAFAALWLIFWRAAPAKPMPTENSERASRIVGVVMLLVVLGLVRACADDIARMF